MHNVVETILCISTYPNIMWLLILEIQHNLVKGIWVLDLDFKIYTKVHPLIAVSWTSCLNSLSFSFFKVSWAPLGWQIGGRLDIAVNVNESGCQMNWKSHCLLDSLIIGSHWLSHSIICITKDYQKLDNAFSFPLPLHSHQQSRSDCLCPFGWTCREFLSH